MKKIYLNQLEEKSNELVNYSKNDIALEIRELKKLTSNFVWEGLAKEKYVENYNKKIDKLEELNNNVCKIAEFLLNVRDNYNNANARIDNAYEELINEINLLKEDKYGM